MAGQRILPTPADQHCPGRAARPTTGTTHTAGRGREAWESHRYPAYATPPLFPSLAGPMVAKPPGSLVRRASQSFAPSHTLVRQAKNGTPASRGVYGTSMHWLSTHLYSVAADKFRARALRPRPPLGALEPPDQCAWMQLSLETLSPSAAWNFHAEGPSASRNAWARPVLNPNGNRVTLWNEA